jgi:OFA family oxalate/formate antiporter-like MFS transporter
MGLLAFAFMTGFNYGGVLVVYASSAARNWGAERVGQTYSWLFSANIPAALSPLLAGYCYDRMGSFTLPLVVIGVLLVLSSLLVGKNRDVVDVEVSRVRPKRVS